ncbi:MAG: hypothetical protein HYV09_19750 [Deltaproteobacteria bacterium]|nr:hypothetical protein [Deltaproteobacteria bacterium]
MASAMPAETKAAAASALLARAPAVQAVLPFFRGGVARARRANEQAGARVARPAIPLRHHAIERMAEQLELRFPQRTPAVYVHEGARQALERRLSALGRQPVVVSITDNRHSMIHATRRDGVLRARLHHMFLDAPHSVIEALARFLLFRDRDASHVVGRYIDGNFARIRSLEPHRRSHKPNAGDHHDLDSIFAEVNETYFDGVVDARICWGHECRAKARKRTTIKLGSYAAQEQLVRVHPRLDQPWVPRYFVAFVVFHEMLHHVMPATRIAGRRALHPPAFRERERAFRHFERALAWEKANLDRLLK